MSDLLQRFVFEHAPVRGEVARLDATWRAVLARHHYPAPVRTLLGELTAAAALLAATLKFDGALVLQAQGKGPVTLLVVECTSDHTLRATAKWDGDIAPAPLRALLGDGQLVITILGAGNRQLYQGVVELDGDSVAEVLENYTGRSEQLATRLWLAVDDERAGGLLLQKLPQAAEDDEDSWEHAVALATTVTHAELLGLAPEQLMQHLFPEDDIRLFRARPASFRCTCSAERVAGMLRTVGRDEVESVLAEQGRVTVHCEFCGQRYEFEPASARAIFAGGGPAPRKR